MGLDAYVLCNCIKERKVKLPPFDINLVTINENMYGLNEDADDYTWRQYMEWKEDACEHPGFYYIYDRVGNIRGCNSFWSAMRGIGRNNFPILSTIWNESVTKPEIIKDAMKELAFLKSRVNQLKGVFLKDFYTSEEYSSILSGEVNWFYSHGGLFKYVLSDDGFSINDSAGTTLFSSEDFLQDVKRISNKGNLKYQVTFIDKKSGTRYISEKPIDRCISWERKEFYFPQRLCINKRNLKHEDFGSIEVLERLFDASICTGNPIVWT